MPFVRSVVKLACFYTVGFLTALPVSAQHNVLPRPTQHQIADFLKSDPTLSSGFETPVHKATVRVVKGVPGGIMLRYETAHAKGTIRIVGSGPAILDKDKTSDYVDWVLGLFGFKSSGGGCKTEVKTTTTTTTTSTGSGSGSGSGSGTTTTTTTTKAEATCEPT